MPSSDYTSTVSGGLKLKGGATDAGIKKKKSKKSKSAKEEASKSVAGEQDEVVGDSKTADTTLALSSRDATPSEREHDRDSERPRSTGPGAGIGKTEAQRRHEEIKRKRLDERLKREGGAKTHKQRVEELNKYLSTLSEHHDMPRIGPG